MSRLLILFIALLLPFQSAWSAASSYCEHETGEQQGKHFGHHFHVHKAGTENASSAKSTTDSDCATCLNAGASAIPTDVAGRDFSSAATAVVAAAIPRFSSALARAPDRPQWRRLV